MSRLERVTYVCLISLSLVSIAILIRTHLENSRVPPQVQLPTAASLVGKRLDIPGAAWNASSLNAVVYLSTECRFCEASAPFYRRLTSEHRGSANGGVALVAISAEPTESVKRHFADEQIAFDHVYQVQLPNTLLRATPTFLIVDRNGVIVRATIGQLNASAEDEMLKVMQTGQFDGGTGF